MNGDNSTRTKSWIVTHPILLRKVSMSCVMGNTHKTSNFFFFFFILQKITWIRGGSRMISQGFDLIKLPHLLYIFGQGGLSKQGRPRSDAAESVIWSGSTQNAIHPAAFQIYQQVEKWICSNFRKSLLTLKAPSKICSRRHSKIFIFFSFFRENKSWYFMTIYMKFQDLFSSENKKKKKIKIVFCFNFDWSFKG